MADAVQHGLRNPAHAVVGLARRFVIDGGGQAVMGAAGVQRGRTLEHIGFGGGADIGLFTQLQ